MRHSPYFLLLAGLASATPVFAADATADTKSPAATAAAGTEPAKTLPAESFEVNGQKFILVSKIGTVEANRSFEQVMQLLRSQYTESKSLQQRMKDASISDGNAISQQIAKINETLQQNNMTVIKTFGVSVESTYIPRVEKSRLYAVIPDDVFAKAKDSASYKAENFIDSGAGKPKLALQNTITGVAENFILREDIQITTALRQRVKRLEAAIAQSTEDADKAKITELLAGAKQAAEKNEAEVTKREGFALPTDFALEAEVTKLFVAVSKEQFDKWQAEQNKPAAAPVDKAAATK